MDYVVEYAHLPQHFKDGYVISAPKDKATLIIIDETLSAEERRKRLDEVFRKIRVDKN